MNTGWWIIGRGSVSIWVGQRLRIMACTRRSRPWTETVRRWLYGLSWLTALLCGCAEQEPQSMSPAGFGPAAIYRPHAEPKGLVLLWSNADQVADARLVEWPADPQPAGGGLDAETRALTLIKWLDPRSPHQSQSSAALPDLPLIESRASDDSNDTLAVLLSGDGGWAAFDKGITAVLAANRISTVGWDSLSYYWKPRTPEQAASDLARLLRHYMASWQKQRLLLIGYSFGADVLPFLIHRLPADLSRQIDGIALFGLAKTAAFEFHLTDWFGVAAAQTYPIAPALSQLHEAPILCVYGESETDSLCPTLAPPIQVAKVPGDHHFKHDYVGLVSHLLDLVPGLNPGPRRQPPGVAP